MKRTLLITVSLLCCIFCGAQEQVANGDFETWTYDGNNLPNNWNSFQTADGKWASSAYSSKNRQVEKSTDTRPGSTGSFSCRIWARKVLAVIAQGNLTTGRVHAGSTSASNASNYNYSDRDGSNTNNKVTNPCAMPFTGRPDALSVWVKFNPKSSGSKAKVSTYIHTDYDFRDGGTCDEGTVYEVAHACTTFSGTSGWKNLIIPFQYNSKCTGDPKYVLMTFCTNETPGKGDENDELYIDDIEMIYYPFYELKIKSSYGWASMYLDFNALVPEDASVYYATGMEAGYITLKEIPAGEVIPANTGVIVTSSSSSITFKYSDKTPYGVSGNIFEGVLNDTKTGSGKYYVLSDETKPDVPAFGQFSGTLGGNKAYIKF